ncbi:MAG TPA: hypothetical protein VNT01_05375 [Symbiobacteriaceae bacterium]|nr:hypothetical protein [Symbiobacteriaceae bacterium]
MQFLIPEGWAVFETAIGDNVQVRADPLSIMVRSHQLRGHKAPMTTEEMRREIQEWAPEAKIKQLQLPGTISAFEVQYVSQTDSGQKMNLELSLYGTTGTETVWFEAPVNQFPEWEPIFRTIMASYQHGNLDAVPLPGRP